MKYYLICYGISNLLMCFWYAIIVWDTARKDKFTWRSFWADMPILVGVGMVASLFIAFVILKIWMFLSIADFLLP